MPRRDAPNLREPSGGTPVLTALPSWALIVAGSTAHYDVLQCYEILRWLEVPDADAYHGLLAEWKKATADHVRDSWHMPSAPGTGDTH